MTIIGTLKKLHESGWVEIHSLGELTTLAEKLSYKQTFSRRPGFNSPAQYIATLMLREGILPRLEMKFTPKDSLGNLIYPFQQAEMVVIPKINEILSTFTI